MSWNATTESFDIGDGRTISIETGRLARQADGAVVVRMGDAAVLATVVSAHKPKEGVNFFPLSVDYQEKFAASGRIPGSFQRREGRPGEHEILICRIIDRAIRPMFPDDYQCETQILVSLISGDAEIMPDTLAGLAASAALAISDIPFDNPLSEVRVARIDGEYVVNPYCSDLERADLDIFIGATEESVVMVEGEAQECSEEELVEAIKVGHEAIKLQCQAQKRLAAKVGKPKRELVVVEENEAIKERVAAFATDKIYAVASAGLGKKERKEGFDAINDEWIASFGEEPDEEEIAFAKKYYKDLEKSVIRNMMLDEKKRLDGRSLTEVRDLYIEVDFLPSPHGSALFSRGETQSLTTTTLGTKNDRILLDKAAGIEFGQFMLHYNFPPFSTGEARPIRGVGRREVGHGNLAQRSLKQVLPSEEDNPYTVRVVSDILESNGSSSMATVCAGSLSLMDAGIQIKSNVSGIAMGLISDGDRVSVLTDILGDEDHLGDMDFKVTGTKNGICAVQMDIKIKGLSYEVLKQALAQAKDGRLHILAAMDEVMSEPRPEPKEHAPRMVKIFIPKEFIGAVIGPGGKIIQEIQKETNTVINIEETADEQGEVTIAGTNKTSIEKALQRIRNITAVPEEGEEYDGTVKSVMPYGAFVEFMPGKEGLLHISEVDWKRLENLDGILAEGDAIRVKLIGVDSRSGKFKLSRKVLIPNPNPGSERDDRGRGDFRRSNDRRSGGGDRDRRGGGRDRRDGGDRRRY